MNGDAVIPSYIKGGLRLELLRIHRLEQFRRAFDLYLNGDVEAGYVTERARKMLKIGLPARLK